MADLREQVNAIAERVAALEISSIDACGFDPEEDRKEQAAIVADLCALAAQPAPAGEVVAFRLVRKRYDGEWVTNGATWTDGKPDDKLLADIAGDPLWRIDYAYGDAREVASVAQAPPAGEVALPEPAYLTQLGNEGWSRAKLIAYGDARAAAAASRPATAAPEGLVMVTAKLTAAAGLMLSEIDTCGHEVDPAYRTTLYEAWEKAKAMLSAAPQPAAVKQDLTTAQGDADEMVCAACGGTGEVHADDGEGPWACYYGCQKPQPEAKAGEDVETEQSIKADCYDMIAEEIERHGVSTTSIVEYVTGLIERDAAQPKPADGGAVDWITPEMSGAYIVDQVRMQLMFSRIEDNEAERALAIALERMHSPAAATRAEEAFEKIAQSWDGCYYDDELGEASIGDRLRNDWRRLAGKGE